MERRGWRAGDLRWRWLLGVVVIALLASRLIVLQGNSAGGEGPGLSTSDRPDQSEVVRAMGQLPRGFVENAGQWDPQAGWSAPGFYGVTWITRNGELRHALVSRGDCAEAPATAAGKSPTVSPSSTRVKQGSGSFQSISQAAGSQRCGAKSPCQLR